MKLKKISSENIRNKKVLLRVDFNVPVQNGKVLEDQKIRETLPTIKFLLKNQASIIIISHLGRPESDLDFTTHNSEFSLEPLTKVLSELLEREVKFVKDILGDNAKNAVKKLKPGDILMLENLRFDAREKAGDDMFAKDLASLADVYVNDAFAVSHRAHSSLFQVTKFIDHYAGFRLQKEVEELSKIIDNPKRPLVVITGGVKIETKLPVIKRMHGLADYILVGGLIADQVKILMQEQREKNNNSVLLVADLTEEKKDITLKSAENFAQIIKKGKTIVWNGPLGLVEKGFDKGSKIVSEAIVNSNAFTVAGGGETLACLKKLKVYEKFSFISTGGGAMLDFLSGKELPGVEVLKE